MAESAQVEKAANANPDLNWWPPPVHDQRRTPHRLGNVYEVKDAPLVAPLANERWSSRGFKSAPSSWLTPSLNWYLKSGRLACGTGPERAVSWPGRHRHGQTPGGRGSGDHVTHTTVTDSS